MRILHTSDWHLGRTFHGSDLTAAYEQWCDYVVEFTRSENIDALLVSGDVFDRGIPPVAMVELLSATLNQILDHTQVILTSGNHDSAKRLGFTSTLLKSGLSIRTDSLESDHAVPVFNKDSELGAYVYALPYLDPDVERRRLSPDPEQLLGRSHESVTRRAIERIFHDIQNSTASANVPILAMAHSFIVGAEPSDSEQDLHIGGINSVPSGVFQPPKNVPGFDYVALGHLHGPQAVGTLHDPLMRYSGSPLAFSFSEENHHKSSVLLDFSEATTNPDSGARFEPKLELIPTPIYHPIATVRDSFSELISGKYSDFSEHFLRIYVTDDERPRNLVARLRKVFPNVIEVHHDIPTVTLRTDAIRASKQNPLDVIDEFYETSGGRPLSVEEKALVTRLWDEVKNRGQR
ncbi:exonuclease SbcCD subunit D [Arcanobacterium ihumii]|uniref:exonuclease SbcCD subunit D n=1 Tax=Arcanobacterium ihumii TaxID=2138162 RepID=UPI000F533C4C|nr:exonuclease SbcCD subunit D [Arcanobacterium ihumii]